MKNKETILRNLIEENKSLRDKNTKNDELIEQLKYELEVSSSTQGSSSAMKEIQNENKNLKDKLSNFEMIINVFKILIISIFNSK